MADSRMSRLEEKRTQRRLVVMILGSVLFIGFIFTIGIPLFVKGTALLGDRGGQSNAGANDKTAPFAPTLSPLVSQTNKKAITIDGYAEPDAKIEVLVNGESVKDAVIGSDGTFSFTDITLKEGVNTISAQATDAAGNTSVLAKEQTVIYKKQAPKLDIQEPQDGQNFGKDNQEITIRGTTDPEVEVRINDRLVPISQTGTFSYRYKLGDGENLLKISVKDQAGNETTKELKVTYSP